MIRANDILNTSKTIPFGIPTRATPFKSHNNTIGTCGIINKVLAIPTNPKICPVTANEGTVA